MLECILYNYCNECWEKIYNKINFGIKVMKFLWILGVVCVCEFNNRELKKYVFLVMFVDWNKMVLFIFVVNVLLFVKISYGFEN